MLELIHRIPILTTVLSAVFTFILYRHWREKPYSLHVFWWMLGVFAYGLGTLTEALTSILGWSEPVFKAWYISGALLGGAPLAQGTVYLTLQRRTAHRLTAIVFTYIALAGILVALSPVNTALVEPYRLTGKVLEWRWVRLFSPFINLYAVSFLIGGAVYSAWRYWRSGASRARFRGNVFIAIGAILPGIGGSFTRFGHTEVLYVTELLGILFIWLGYATIKNDPTPSIYAAQAAQTAEG